MFGQCSIFVYLELRSILMLCEQGKIGEYGGADRIFNLSKTVSESKTDAFDFYFLSLERR